MANVPAVTIYQAGSHNSPAIGLESQFVYNGLVINDLLSSIETYKLTDIEGFDDADIRDSRDINPSRWGEAPHQPEVSGRTMVLTGEIWAGNTFRLRDMEQALKNAFQLPYDNSELPLVIQMPHTSPVPPILHINCRKVDKVSLKRKMAENIYKTDFQISLRASNPRYLGATLHSTTVIPTASTVQGRIYDKTYDTAYTTYLDASGNPVAGASNTVVINNAGNIRAQPIIQFNGLFNSGTTLTNITNGKVIKLAQQITSGDYLKIDINTGAITDSLGNNRSSYVDPVSDDLELESGNNTLALGLQTFDANTRLIVSWYDTYW